MKKRATKTRRRGTTRRDPAVTTRIMRAVRATGSRAERALASALWRQGLRYRKNDASLLGRPDLVFARWKCAVFVDGDFWHARVLRRGGRQALRASLTSTNRNWWIAKLERNAARDRHVNRSLRSAGYRVYRVWESDVLANAEVVATRLANRIRRTSPTQA
jgi:DNA mismatch endonuclease (patch repair protein)